MENNNKEEKKNVKAAGKKLSYEEMSMALQQYSSQLNMCAKENAMLKQEIYSLSNASFIEEMKIMLKIVENAASFPQEFVNKTVEKIMSAFEDKPQEDNQEKKED